MGRLTRAPLRAALAALCVLGALWAIAWPYTVDDAHIVARYALRLASGRGYTYNDGVVSDGVTGPLWLLPLTLGARVGVPPIALAKWLGALASGCAVLLVVVTAGSTALGRRAAWATAIISVSALPLVVWSVAGLETGLATLCATLAALASTARPRPHATLAGLAMAALLALRPELAAFSFALCGSLALRDRRAARRAVVIVLAGATLLVGFRLMLFGHVLPLSASAKPALLESGIAYVGRALLTPRALLVALGLGLALWSGRARAQVVVVALLVQAVAFALAGGDWMPGRRLFAPLVPLLALALGLSFARGSIARPRSGALLLLALAASSVFELAPELARVRAAGLRQRAQLPVLARAVCAERGPIATVDVGALGVACAEHAFVDLGGLTDPEIARAAGGHLDKRIGERTFAARAPGLILLHSRERPRIDQAGRVRWFAGYPIERRVLAFPSVQAGYRVRQVVEYADDYFYLLLVPRR